MHPNQDIATSTAPATGLNPGEDMAFRVLTEFDESEVSRDEWDALVAAQNGNLYMTFDWCRTWWRFYGRNRDLHILVFRRGDELVAILPMFVETLWLGPVWLKLAKPIGADFSIQLCNFPVREGRAAAVLREAIPYFTGTCGCDAVLFSPLSAHFNGFTEFQAACRADAPGARLAQDQVIDCHSIFGLPADFESYLGSIGKSQRANYKRDLNLLRKSFTVATDTISEPARLTEEFGVFSKMHKIQWNSEGKQGHFQDWPHSYEFNLELVKAQAEHGRARLYRLLLNGEPAAYQYGFVFNDWLYWRLPARVSGKEWNRFGLGRMGLAKLLESAIAEGVRFVEGGQGHYEYKTQMGATESDVHSLVIVSEKTGAMGRYRLMKMLSELLTVAYYKVLYRRIYPRVRFLRRPFARIWIRSRF
jgi:CelD/BcsL family acetyltransferase involved in cellulose biosynthesis